MLIEEVMMVEEDLERYNRIKEVMVRYLQEDKFSGEVKKLIYTIIVEKYKERKDLEADNIQVSRNVIDLFVEVLKLHQK